MRIGVAVLLTGLALTACGEEGDETDPQDGAVLDRGRPDAQVADSSNPMPDAGCGLPPTYKFHFEGGLNPASWTYAVQGSSLHKTMLSSAMPDAGAITCTIHLGCEVAGIVDGDELGAVFFPADVRSAFTTADTVLGIDPRNVDGEILVIEAQDGKKLQIGSPCGSVPGCTPIPPNIETLRMTLVKLVAENKPSSASVDGGSAAEGCEEL